MSHTVAPRDNALSRSVGTVPMWLIQSIVGVLLAGALTWVTFIAGATAKNTVEIAVVHEQVGSVKGDIGDIKEAQKETNRKLDRLLERRQ